MLDAIERPLRVQIVEDERIVALDLRAGLEQLGFDVVGIAANEHDALQLAETTAPDVVLMDIKLDDGSDGISAACRIRERLALPVVFLSAFGEPETLERAAAAVPYGYLLKPFELRELNATVRMAVVRHEEDRQAERARLRQQQALLAFDATDEAILLLDAQQRVLSSNPAFTRLTGWSEEAVLARRPDDFLYARRHGDKSEIPVPRRGEVTCRRVDASLFPALEHMNAVKDEKSGAITHHVLGFSDISEIRDTQFKLRQQALHDPLTGLGNRLMLQETLHSRTSRPQSAAFALLFIDLDGFKTINDTLGHDQGDELLKSVAQRLQSILRREDLAIRLGGDEFVVLMNEPGQPGNALLLAHKLLDATAKSVMLSGQQVNVTGSIGVALYPDHASDQHGLLKAADAAMYEAKAQGRNRAAMFEHALADIAAEHLLLEQGLRRAMELGQLSLQWQPMVGLEGKILLGAEALLRWEHPTLGSVAPARFIPLAEATGLICPIGAWVLDQACAQAAAWLYAGNGLARVSVNVSVRQFEQDDVLRLVKQTLQRHGLPPERLEIEVTESLFANGVAMRRALSALRELGVRVALDDFGTGFSSLGQLKNLPMDRLKIDRSFVADLTHDPSSRAIVQTIITLARSLGLEITAEGVEQADQQTALRELGVGEVQGWLFHRALSTDQMQAMLLAAH